MLRPSPLKLAVTVGFVWTALFVSAGCTGPSDDPVPPQKSRGPDTLPASTAGSATAGSATAGSATAGSATKGPSTEAPPPAIAKKTTEGKDPPPPVSPALKNLTEKLQPPGSTTEDPEALERQKAAYAEQIAQVVAQFVKGIEKGDGDAVRKLLLTSTELNQAVKPGVRPILAGSLLSTNEGLLGQLLERLKGTSLRSTWSPGEIVLRPPRSIYDTPVQALGKGSLELRTQDDALVIVRLDQLVRLADGWRIFQVTVP